jgi:hypothetical protein
MRTVARRDAEVLAALERNGLRARALQDITALGLAAGERRTFRVVLADGRTVKARRLPDEATAERLMAVRSELPPAFARVLSRDRRVLIEEWVAGAPLGASCPSNALLDEASSILASLHARTHVVGEPVGDRRSTAHRRAVCERELGEIASAGGLDGRRILALRVALERLDPGRALHGLAHNDFCGENMVVDASGALRVIDNERLEIDALGYDLGRTWYRWALPKPAWERFRAAYAARAASPEPLESLAFWNLAAAVKSAAIRLRADRMQARAPLALLERMAAAGDARAVAAERA